MLQCTNIYRRRSRDSTPPRGLPERSFTCTTAVFLVRLVPEVPYERSANMKNCPCCAIIFYGLTERAAMIAFHGFIDDSSIVRYAEKCADDGTIVIAYFEEGVVRGLAELHAPQQSPGSLPEIAFSVETPARRRGVGSFLFRQLIAEARAKCYRKLRITTGAQNVAMRALANKFGAQLTFSQGESTGTVDVIKQDQPETAAVPFASTLAAARSIAALNRAYWRMLFKMYRLGRTA
jgi:GNAT superfamily N-acetyltransferase